MKDATDQTARVELHTQCQTINVDKSRLQLVGAPGGGVRSVSVYGKTPQVGEGGGMTPGGTQFGGKTPMYGAQTPMYGSQTPAFDGTLAIISHSPFFHVFLGNRTPYYGSTTPAYESGNRTPGGPSSAWDPTVSNTPSHR